MDSELALDATLGAALERVARVSRALTQESATRHGLSALQVDMLQLLAGAPPPPHRASDIARELGVAAPTVTGAINTLREKGLLTEEPEPRDRRRRTLVLTRAGLEIGAELVAERSAVHGILRSLPLENRAAVLEALVTLLGAMKRAGLLAADYSCGSCRFFRPGQAHCTLLDVPLRPAGFRVHCPEHEAA